MEPVDSWRQWTHERTLDIRIVRKGTIVGVDVNDIALDLPGVQDVKGVAQSVCGCSVSSTSVAHENLDGAHIISTT